MEIYNLANTSVEDIAELMNRAFSDYILPIHVTKAYLETRFRRANVDLRRSYAISEGQKLYGMLVNSFEDDICNCLVAGIDPEKRGSGMLKKMFFRAFKENNGIRTYLVEVLQQNAKAIHIYSSLGFEIKRSYTLLKGRVEGKGGCTTALLSIDNSKNLKQRFAPSFENTIPALLRAGGFELYVSQNGYLIANESGACAQIGGDYDEILSSLDGERILTFGNIDERDEELISCLKRRGFTEYARQYEMHRPSDPSKGCS